MVPDSVATPTATGFSARAKSRKRIEIFVNRSASAMMLSRNLRRSSSSIAGASTSSRSSSAAPCIDVSGDLSSWDTWVAKVEIKLERAFSRRAISRKLCDRRANSLVPWRLSGRSALRLPLPTRSVRSINSRIGPVIVR